MAASNLKLCDAITQMDNGIASIDQQIANLKRDRSTIADKLTGLEAERAARAKMLGAMRELQGVVGEDETLKFVVPSGA